MQEDGRKMLLEIQKAIFLSPMKLRLVTKFRENWFRDGRGSLFEKNSMSFSVTLILRSHS